IDEQTTATSLVSPRTLANGSSYRWHVKSLNSKGDSAWSSDWTFNVALPPTVSLTASPTTVDYNGSSTLRWDGRRAASCTASGGWSGTKATAGSETAGPLTATVTFDLSCTGGGGTATASATVTVNPPAPTVSLTASPTTVDYNGSSTL